MTIPPQFHSVAGLHAVVGAHLWTGDFKAGRTAAISLIETLREFGSPIVPAEALDRARTLLSCGEVSHDDLRTVHALAGAALQAFGPDRYNLHLSGEDRFVDVRIADQISPQSLEEGLDDWGQRIWAGLQRKVLNPARRIQNTLFEQMMADPEFRKRVIFFLEALTAVPPAAGPGLLTRHFPKGTVPGKTLLAKLLRIGGHPFVPSGLTQIGMQKALKGMAARFLAGSTTNEALKTVRRWEKMGVGTTLDIVRENVVSDEEADQYAKSIRGLMQAWAREPVKEPRTPGGVPVRHISLKLSALTPRFDPLAEKNVRESLEKRLLPILKEAKTLSEAGRPVMLNIDIEELNVRDLTYRVFCELLAHKDLEGWDDAAIVVQAYLADSEEVLMNLISFCRRLKKRPQIRIVKGAYHRYEQFNARRNGWQTPVYLTQEETDRNFFRLARLAMENHDAIRIAVGTHNVLDVATLQALREKMGIPIEELEFQVLLGVGNDLIRGLVRTGSPVRVYAPLGSEMTDALSYLVRRLDEVVKGSAVAEVRYSGEWNDYRERRRGRRPIPPAPPPEKGGFENEREENWALGMVRGAMEQAIAEMRGRFPFQINAGTGPVLESVNPARIVEVVGQVAQAVPSDLPAIEAAAERGFEAWSSKKTQKERSGCLRRAAEIARQRKFDLAALLVLEAGKTWNLAMGEVNEMIDFLVFYADQAEKDAKFYDPLGVVLAITPFNFPFSIAMGEAAGALALGNAVILKPSRDTMVAGWMVANILREAGVPAEAIQFVPGEGKTIGDALVRSRHVDAIVLTGSKETADRIIEAAAETPPLRGGVKRIIAETSGKNALYVGPTADLDVAFRAAANDAFGHAGQRCSALGRLFVHRSVAERFIHRLVEGARAMGIGPPSLPETQVSPLISRNALDKAKAFAEKGRLEGRLLLEREIGKLAESGFFLGPQIYLVGADAEIAREEGFCPVLPVVIVDSPEEAVENINKSRFALTAGIVSRDPVEVRDFLERVDAGNIYVNRGITGAMVGRHPFGGFKASGTGPKAGGPLYVSAFGRPKSRWEGHLVHPDATHPSQRDISAEMRAANRAQKDWAARPVEERADLILKVAETLEQEANGELREEFLRAAALLRAFAERAPSIVRPHPTEPVLPGEINREAFDRPLGVGLLWENGEFLSEMIAATGAALLMGNGFARPPGTFGDLIASYFRSAGVPKDLIPAIEVDPNFLRQSPLFDFAVASGAQSGDVGTGLLRANGRRETYARFIDDSADSPHYLTHFAHSRVLSVWTLIHFADVGGAVIS